MPMSTPGGRIFRVPPPAMLPLGSAVRTASNEYTAPDWLAKMPKTGFEKVLVIRGGGLGDVLMTTPIIRYLAQVAGLKVHVATDPHYICLFDHSPDVTAVHNIYEIVEGDWLYRIDFREYAEHPDNQTQHRIKAFADGCHIPLTNYNLAYCITPEEIGDLPAMPEQLISYVWATSTSNRNWDMKSHLANIEALCDYGFTVALLHHEVIDLDFKHTRLLNMSGKLGLRDVALVMNASKAVISPDTGLFHLASALGKKIIAYFGAFPLKDRQSHGDVFLVNQPEKMPCFPCRGYSCVHMAGTTHGAPCLTVAPDVLVRQVAEVAGVI